MSQTKEQVYHLHPTDWENDPEEERWDVSLLDYNSPKDYFNYAVYFRLDKSEKTNAISVIKAGLERTLSQARHLCGIIAKTPEGGHCFLKKKTDTVKFIVQWLDAPEDNYPTLDEIERGGFGAAQLGDRNRWCVPPLLAGESPEAHIDNNPIMVAYKANVVQGGLVFVIVKHHFANDVMGWNGWLRQFAENCYAILHGTPFPSWDMANLDRSRYMRPIPPEDRQSKAAELKRVATPTDGSWISTYDAFVAMILRTVARLRTPVFGTDLSSVLPWVEAVDMRRRLNNPPVPARLQGNNFCIPNSTQAPVQQPTVSELISEWPFTRLAQYVRQMTDTATEEALDQALEKIAMTRDKTEVCGRPTRLQPGTIAFSDHRDVRITEIDFGFAKPLAYRLIFEDLPNGLFIAYPPRNESPESDEGPEFALYYEKQLAQDLIDDMEFGKYFEYRGVDSIERRYFDKEPLRN